jgi:hypothetical protein
MEIPRQRLGEDQRVAASARIACVDDLGGEDLQLRSRHFSSRFVVAPYIRGRI